MLAAIKLSNYFILEKKVHGHDLEKWPKEARLKKRMMRTLSSSMGYATVGSNKILISICHEKKIVDIANLVWVKGFGAS